MESKTTSKTSCLKALLLSAWRERWTDLQWGINIKTVLPRGVSGDVYNLADCILQQAVVGAGANQLVLSYLRHSLSAQVVSHAAVLQRLSKFNQLNKEHCVYSLLEFLEGMLPGVTCCGKPEETVLLVTSVLSVALWLLNILQQCQSKANIVKKSTELLKILLTEEFYISLICLARYNDPELFTETNIKCSELVSILTETEEALIYVKKLENIDVNVLRLPVISENWPGSLIQCWLGVKLIGNPGSSTLTLAQQLHVFQCLKGYNDTRLYAELIRGTLLYLYNVTQTTNAGPWGAFAFMKLPHILLKLAGKSDSTSVVRAVELILQHSPLLDAMDANSNFSSLICLLEELGKIRLLSDQQVKLLLEKRGTPPPSLKIDASPESNEIYWHVCAETSLSGLLKTLSTDFNKIQDGLVGMLHQVFEFGKINFELILAVATVKGQLRTLVNRLIEFNEYFISGGDKVRSRFFDITFVMLVAIVQNYGTATVLDKEGGSLFERWVHSSMVERQKPKAPDQILRLGDPALIESLLEQFNSGESDFPAGVKWQDVLFNIAGVMHEVLIAWEQGALVPSDVKRILDAVRGKMCCLALAAAAWLCAYMRTAPQNTLLKPINMVQQLLATPLSEDENLGQLTREIIRKMQRDVQLPLLIMSNHHLVSRQPATEQLRQVWKQAITRGWLDHSSATILHCLLDTAGDRWLVSAVIEELMELRYKDQLQRGVDLALAIFHVDIAGCTLQLLSHVLPRMLYNDVLSECLVAPQLPALARLTSYCVYTAWDALSDDAVADADEPLSKRPHLSDRIEDTNPQGRLLASLRELLLIVERGIQEGTVTQQTYFVFYLIKSLVEVKIDSCSAVLAAIPPSLITDLLKTLPELFNYPLLIHLHDVRNNSGRINMAKDLCVLRNYYLRNAPSVNSNSN